jgi:hypothetical protein
LGHGRDHRVEQPSGRGGGVDGLLEGDKVGVVFSENVSEIEQFFSIPGESGKLGKNEPGYMAGLDMIEHFLGLGQTHDGFTRDRFKVIDFLDLPAFGFGIVQGALLVVLRAFTPSLVFGRDPNPDADGLWGVHFLFFPQSNIISQLSHIQEFVILTDLLFYYIII